MRAFLPNIVIIALLLLATAGCQSSSNLTPALQSTAGPILTFTRPPQRAALTPSPSFAPDTVTPIPTENPAPSDTPTPLPSATADPLLASARILGLSWVADYNLLLSIQFTSPVRAEDYQVIIEEEETYECQVLSQFPDRLYCIGRGRNVYDRMKVQIFAPGAQVPGFEARTYVPYFSEDFRKRPEPEG